MGSYDNRHRVAFREPIEFVIFTGRTQCISKVNKGQYVRNQRRMCRVA